MRDVAVTEGDKVEAELRFGVSVNTYGRQRPGGRGRRGRRRRRSTRWSPSTRTPTTSRPSCARRRPARVAALRRPHRGRAARVPRPTGGFGAFTTNFEDLGGLRQLPGLAVQRLMADGYGFGGEGDWKTSVLLAHPQGDGRGAARRHLLHGGLHLPPRARRGEDPRRAHARGLPDSIAAARPALRDPPARHRRPRGPGAAGLRRRARAGRGARHAPTWATGSGWSPTRSRSSRPTSRCRSCPVARAVWRPAPDLRTSAESWLTAGGPHHTVLSTALTTEHLDDFAEMLRTELVLIDADTTVAFA